MNNDLLREDMFPGNELFSLLFEDIKNLPPGDRSEAEVILQLLGESESDGAEAEVADNEATEKYS